MHLSLMFYWLGATLVWLIPLAIFLWAGIVLDSRKMRIASILTIFAGCITYIIGLSINIIMVTAWYMEKFKWE